MSSPSERLADLLIVGAGILGLSAAIQAANTGLRVIIFERNVSPVGATRRNFGMIGTSTLAHPSGLWRQYALESRKFYQDIQAETNISFQQRDGLYLANTDEEWQVLQEFAGLSPDHAIPSRLLSKEQLAQDYQYLDPDRLKGGLLLPEDYSVEPSQIGNALLSVVRAHHNIRVLTQSCVTQVKSADNHVSLKLADGQYFSAKKILITNGDVTDILYPDLLQQAGLKRCALQMAKTLPFHQSLNASIYSGLSIRRYPAFEICPSFDVLMRASVPEIVDAYGIHILIKQTADGGLIIGDSHEYHTLDEPPQFHQREALNRFITGYCHEQLGIKLPEIQERWNGYYLTHPTEQVLVAEPDPNIHIVCAIAGKGMTTGPGFMLNLLKNNIL